MTNNNIFHQDKQFKLELSFIEHINRYYLKVNTTLNSQDSHNEARVYHLMFNYETLLEIDSKFSIFENVDNFIKQFNPMLKSENVKISSVTNQELALGIKMPIFNDKHTSYFEIKLKVKQNNENYIEQLLYLLTNMKKMTDDLYEQCGKHIYLKMFLEKDRSEYNSNTQIVKQEYSNMFKRLQYELFEENYLLRSTIESLKEKISQSNKIVYNQGNLIDILKNQNQLLTIKLNKENQKKK